MPDYEYGNARLRVMKSRLLSNRELEILTDAGSLQGMIATLAKTIYQKSIETALTRTAGIKCIDETLKSDLVVTIGKIRGFYMESAGKMVAILLMAYDIHNLKAILRGLSKNVPTGDILTVVLPIGNINMSTLRELAQLNNPREAIDILASMGLPFAWPLLNVRAEVPGAEIFEMELALDKWYYEEARQTLRSETGMVDQLSKALALDADLTNVLTAFRFAQSTHERDLLRDRLGTSEIAHLFVGPGFIPFGLLESASQQTTITAAIETLSGTFLETVLRAGAEVYAHSSRLSDIEKKLMRYRLQWMAGQIKQDPLGIGVVLGYVALKINEINNIRWIAHEVNLGAKPGDIRAGLEVIT